MNKYFTYGAIIIVLIIGFFALRTSLLKKDDQSQVLTTNTIANQTTMKATLTTNKGIIEIELLNELAPNTVQNFTELSKNNFYDGVKFHRVIDGFMIQSGDPLSKDDTMMDYWGTGGPGYSFEDEIHAENHNVVGTISMANAGPNTNGSQFFINTADNSFLDTKHTVFGKVTTGMDIVKEIEKVDTYPNDRPIEAVVIESIDIN
jgi:cyclophilin family peptidyl-prolyl cis-trans isomerase